MVAKGKIKIVINEQGSIQKARVEPVGYDRRSALLLKATRAGGKVVDYPQSTQSAFTPSESADEDIERSLIIDLRAVVDSLRDYGPPSETDFTKVLNELGIYGGT